MANFFKPRRGKKATAISQKIVLKRGEVFFEVPDTGVGTDRGKVKMGDGTTPYKDLPYFLDPSSGGDTVELTMEEYNMLPDTKYSDNVNYFIKDQDSTAIKSVDITYNNLKSNLKSTNVQDALDEIDKNIKIVNNSIVEKENTINNNTEAITSINQKINGLSFWTGTKAEYDAISSKSATTIYFIKNN